MVIQGLFPVNNDFCFLLIRERETPRRKSVPFSTGMLASSGVPVLGEDLSRLLEEANDDTALEAEPAPNSNERPPKKDTPIYLCGSVTSRKGKLCKVKVKHEGGKCRYHKKESFPYRNMVFASDGPGATLDWEHGELCKNTAVVRQLRVVYRQAHESVKKDQPGWLYVYYLEDDESSTYWKIGRTSRPNVYTRLEEWPGATLRYAIEVPFNQLAERLVFLYLDDVRLIRYVYKGASRKSSGKLYLSVWKSNGELVEDRLTDRIRWRGPGQKFRSSKSFPPIPENQVRRIRRQQAVNFGNRSKETEWFKAKYSEVEDVVRSVATQLHAWCRTGEKVEDGS